MTEARELTPERFEILAVRELRKAGFEVTDVRKLRQAALGEPAGGYLLELTTVLTYGAGRHRALVACQRQDIPLERDHVERVARDREEANVDVAVLFAALELAPSAVQAGEEHGITVFRVVDGRTAFDLGGLGTPGHYPAWLPAYCAQAPRRDAAGLLQYRLLQAGDAEVILGQ